MAKEPTKGKASESNSGNGKKNGEKIAGKADLQDLHKENRFSPTREWEYVKMKNARKTRGEFSFLGLTLVFLGISVYGIHEKWGWWLLPFLSMMVASFAALTALHMINVDKWLPKIPNLKVPWLDKKAQDALPAGGDADT
jgi:hypothetical protein